MKKYLALILGVFVVLGFAASAFAAPAEIPAGSTAAVATGTTQVTLGGEIRIRGEFQQNVTDFDDNKGDHRAFYDERVRLNIGAKVTPNTQGFVEIEAGDGKGVNNFTWGNESDGAKGIYPYGETKRGTFNITQAWILNTGSGLLGVPAGIKVGHMPLALGNKLFFNHTLYGDDAVVVFADPTKELHLGLLTVKLREGNIGLNDDSTAYVGLFVYKAGKDATMSGDVVYVDDQAASPGGTGLWNFGLRGDGRFNGLGVKADVEIQSGKMKGVPSGDVKLTGYAFLAGLDYTVSNVKLVAEYAFGSGDKSDTSKKFEGFVTGLSQTVNYTYVYDYRAVTAARNIAGASVTGTGISNTQYIKVGASTPLAKELTGGLDVYWLKANKNSTAVIGGVTTLGTSKTIGTEIDWKVTYKIDKNLQYWVEGGYLMAGGFYDTKSHNADDAYAIRHGIQLNF